MRISALEPHTELRPYVASYRIVEDWDGDFADAPIFTCPEPIGVLSVNFGRPTFQESGALHPRVGLLGIQTQIRRWVAQSETAFVMAMLTVPGLMTFFPNIGQDSANNLLDVAGLWGDQKATEFEHCIPASLQPLDVKDAMDKWLLALLAAASRRKGEYHRQTYQTILANKRLDISCEKLGVTQRTLQREFRRHIGVSPKQIVGLHRLQHSIKANVASGTASSPHQFSDQSHQIRSWQKYLGRTPSCYKAKDRSALANVFSSASSECEPPIFYL